MAKKPEFSYNPEDELGSTLLENLQQKIFAYAEELIQQAPKSGSIVHDTLRKDKLRASLEETSQYSGKPTSELVWQLEKWANSLGESAVQRETLDIIATLTKGRGDVSALPNPGL